MADARRRHRAIVHPVGIGTGQHLGVETAGAAGAVLDRHLRIALAQRRQQAVEAAHVREVAAAVAVVVIGAGADQPAVEVDFQVVGTGLVEEGEQTVADPLPRFLVGQTDLGLRRRRIVMARLILPVLLGEESLAGLAGAADRRHVDAFGLDPDGELEATAPGVIGEHAEPLGEPRAVDLPRAESGAEVEAIVGVQRRIPAGVELEELAADVGERVDLTLDQVGVDVGAEREPGVVGGQLRERAAGAAAGHPGGEGLGAGPRRAVGQSDERMRELDRAIGPDGHRHVRQPEVHVGPGRGAPQHRPPAAGPRQSEQQPVVAGVEPEPWQCVSRREHGAAEAHLLPVVDPGRAPGEGTAVGIGRVVTAMPPGIARGHLEAQAVEIAQRRLLVGADRRPHLDHRRARRHRVVPAHGDRPVAVGERQGQHRPTVDVGGFGGDEAKRAVADRHPLVADRDVGVGGAGDDHAVPVGTGQAQHRKPARGVEAEPIGDGAIADLPLTPVRRFPDERVVDLDRGAGMHTHAAEAEAKRQAEQDG